MSTPVSLAAVQDLIDQLAGVDMVRSASMDPADLQSTPCVWVQLEAITQPYLQGGSFRVRCHLIVGDTDGGIRAAQELVDLYNAVLIVVTPDGETLTETVTMPDGTVCPALMLPVDVPANPPE